MQRLGVDTGGTFTDAVRADGAGGFAVHKLPTVQEDSSRAVLPAVDALAPEGPVELVHGTTHATNALLTGRLGRVVLVTTRGFRDLLAIGRQDRDVLYALQPTASRPPQPRRRIVEVAERLDAGGRTVEKLTGEEVARVVESVRRLRPQAVAVGLLHAWLQPVHERRLGRALAKLGVPVVLSSEVAPEQREVERFTTAWADAALIPVVAAAFARLRAGIETRGGGSSVRIMRSDGGTASVDAAAEHPVHLALSGPAGGLSAAATLAQARGDRALMTLDMGGTSTDVAWLDEAGLAMRPMAVGPLPLLVRGMPIHSVGTGGGSLAHVDAGGAVAVGPQSAGARPGPACYGRGGRQPTVTDAHLLCGRLHADDFLDGAFGLDAAASAEAFARLGAEADLDAVEAARAVLAIASADMERALRRVSLAEGRDPRGCPLYSFGGAGGLHAAWVAARLGMDKVVVPPHPGAFSALGMLAAPARRSVARSVMQPLPAPAARRALFTPLVEEAVAALTAEGVAKSRLTVRRVAELRGEGQAGSLALEDGPRLLERFHEAHEARYGYRREDRPVLFTTARVTVDGPASAPWAKRRTRRHEPAPHARREGWFGEAGRAARAGWYRREALAPGALLRGPAVVAEYSATTVVPPGWTARVDAWDCLVLEAGR